MSRERPQSGHPGHQLEEEGGQGRHKSRTAAWIQSLRPHGAGQAGPLASAGSSSLNPAMPSRCSLTDLLPSPLASPSCLRSLRRRPTGPAVRNHLENENNEAGQEAHRQILTQLRHLRPIVLPPVLSHLSVSVRWTFQMLSAWGHSSNTAALKPWLSWVSKESPWGRRGGGVGGGRPCPSQPKFPTPAQHCPTVRFLDVLLVLCAAMLSVLG